MKDALIYLLEKLIVAAVLLGLLGSNIYLSNYAGGYSLALNDHLFASPATPKPESSPSPSPTPVDPLTQKISDILSSRSSETGTPGSSVSDIEADRRCTEYIRKVLLSSEDASTFGPNPCPSAKPVSPAIPQPQSTADPEAIRKSNAIYEKLRNAVRETPTPDTDELRRREEEEMEKIRREFLKFSRHNGEAIRKNDADLEEKAPPPPEPAKPNEKKRPY